VQLDVQTYASLLSVTGLLAPILEETGKARPWVCVHACMCVFTYLRARLS